MYKMADNSVPEVSTKKYKKCINVRSPEIISEKMVKIGRIDFEKSYAQNWEVSVHY